MAWEFRRDPICKAQVPIYPSTSLSLGELVARTSNHGYAVTSTALVSTTGGSTAQSLHVVVGVCQSPSTIATTLAYVAKVTQHDEMRIPVSTAVASTWLTSTNIGTYMYLYDTSHINGSTGATVPTHTSNLNTVLCLTGFSTQEDCVYGYIPADLVS